MATVLPSPIGQAAQSAADNIIRILLARKNEEIAKRQVAVQEESVRLRGEELALSQGEAEARRRAEAFDRAVTMSQILRPGQAPADYPALVPIFRDAFPDIDDEDFIAFSQIPWQSETLQTVLEEEGRKILSELPEGDPLRERAMHNLLLGRPITDEELRSEETVARLRGDQADLIIRGMEAITSDPEVIENAVRVSLGLGQKINVPGLGEFDSSTSASIFAQLLMHRDSMNLRQLELDEQSRVDIAGEIIELGRDIDVPIGRVGAQAILDSYVESVSEDFEPGQSPLDSLYESSDEATRKVIQAFVGGLNVAEDAWIESQPESVQTFLRLGGALTNAGVPAEERIRVMQDLTKQGMLEGFGVAGNLRLPLNPKFQFQNELDVSNLNPVSESLLTDLVGPMLREGISSSEINQVLQSRGFAPLSEQDLNRALSLFEQIDPTQPEQVDSSVPSARPNTEPPNPSTQGGVSRGPTIGPSVEVPENVLEFMRQNGVGYEALSQALRIQIERRSSLQESISQLESLNRDSSDARRRLVAVENNIASMLREQNVR